MFTFWDSTNRAYAGMCDMTIYLAARHLTVLITKIGAATYWKEKKRSLWYVIDL